MASSSSSIATLKLNIFVLHFSHCEFVEIFSDLCYSQITHAFRLSLGHLFVDQQRTHAVWNSTIFDFAFFRFSRLILRNLEWSWRHTNRWHFKRLGPPKNDICFHMKFTSVRSLRRKFKFSIDLMIRRRICKRNEISTSFLQPKNKIIFYFFFAAIFQRNSVNVGQIRLIGIATCLYLCMDACGNLYGSVSVLCLFFCFLFIDARVTYKLNEFTLQFYDYRMRNLKYFSFLRRSKTATQNWTQLIHHLFDVLPLLTTLKRMKKKKRSFLSQFNRYWNELTLN